MSKYQKKRYETDPEYKAAKQQRKQEYVKKRYNEDPEYAEKVRAWQRERYARKKAEKLAAAVVDDETPRV